MTLQIILIGWAAMSIPMGFFLILIVAGSVQNEKL